MYMRGKTRRQWKCNLLIMTTGTISRGLRTSAFFLLLNARENLVSYVRWRDGSLLELQKKCIKHGRALKIELELGVLVFVEWGNPEKNPRCKDDNLKQTQPTYDAGCRIRTRPHWWEASALNTAPSLHPSTVTVLNLVTPPSFLFFVQHYQLANRQASIITLVL